MKFDQGLGEGKTQARTLIGFGVLTFDLFEGLSEARQILCGYANAGITHCDHQPLTQHVVPNPSQNCDLAAARREFDGVRQ